MMAKKKNIPTTSSLPLVAIDLGSSSFKLMAAEQVNPSLEEGSPLRILASEESRKYSCVKKGIIDGTGNASYMITESMQSLSNRLNRKTPLPIAFVLQGGKTMQCVSVRAKRDMGVLRNITQSQLDEMRNECFLKIKNSRSQKDPSKQFAAVGVYVEGFRIDDKVVPYEPRAGASAKKEIEGYYSTFYGDLELAKNVTYTFEHAGKSVEAGFARPVALLEALATEDDEQLGVAIIDMGAETTTLSVFKAGRFLTCRVIPYGGKNITMDIQQLGISQENAEKLKVKYGSAFETKDTKKTIRVKAAKEGDEPVLIDTDFLSTVIVARMEETMMPIFKELQKYEDQIHQVYITGGACKLRNIQQYIQQHTPMKVEYGSHADWLDRSTPDEYYSPEYSATIGALLLGAKYRKKHPDQPIPGTPFRDTPTFIDNVIKFFSDEHTKEAPKNV